MTSPFNIAGITPLQQADDERLRELQLPEIDVAGLVRALTPILNRAQSNPQAALANANTAAAALGRSATAGTIVDGAQIGQSVGDTRVASAALAGQQALGVANTANQSALDVGRSNLDAQSQFQNATAGIRADLLRTSLLAREQDAREAAVAEHESNIAKQRADAEAEARYQLRLAAIDGRELEELQRQLNDTSLDRDYLLDVRERIAELKEEGSKEERAARAKQDEEIELGRREAALEGPDREAAYLEGLTDDPSLNREQRLEVQERLARLRGDDGDERREFERQIELGRREAALRGPEVEITYLEGLSDDASLDREQRLDVQEQLADLRESQRKAQERADTDSERERVDSLEARNLLGNTTDEHTDEAQRLLDEWLSPAQSDPVLADAARWAILPLIQPDGKGAFMNVVQVRAAINAYYSTNTERNAVIRQFNRILGVGENGLPDPDVVIDEALIPPAVRYELFTEGRDFIRLLANTNRQDQVTGLTERLAGNDPFARPPPAFASRPEYAGLSNEEAILVEEILASVR